jgi:hypothetical protein
MGFAYSFPLHSDVIVSLETENSISKEATDFLIICALDVHRSAGKVVLSSPSSRQLFVVNSQIQFSARQPSESTSFM